MKHKLLWIVFFIICLGAGFLHGFLPQGITKDFFIRPTKISVLTTDELLFPKELRTYIENEMHIKLEVTVTRDWNTFLAKAVASPSADLVFIPSHWAKTMNQQGLLAEMQGPNEELLRRAAADFNGTTTAEKNLSFLPIYWLKTDILSSKGSNFEQFLKDKTQKVLFLLADEDLLLKHYDTWKEQNLLGMVAQKKILTLQLEQLTLKDREGAVEVPTYETQNVTPSLPQTSAIIIWGAGVPISSAKKDVAYEVLNILTTPAVQESILLKTSFNSALSQVTDLSIPLNRRASFIRNLQLKDTLFIDKKDAEANLRLKNEYGLVL